jgi:hypothetical protein
MSGAGGLEYALARMQCRLSRRPSDAAWAAIEEARDLSPVLDCARRTSLAPLVGALPAEPGLPSVDRAARRAWSQTVREAMAWMPAEWSQAIAWCDFSRERDARVHPTILPSLGLPAWRERWPAGGGREPLERLSRLFERHLERFRRADPHEAVPLRRDFEARLRAAMRRDPTHPVAAFAWLSLAALDIERLRGEIALRVAFPEARLAA